MPSPTVKKNTGALHSTLNLAEVNAAGSRYRSTPLRTTLLTALGLTALAGLILGGGYLADHMPQFVLAPLIVVLGVMFGALLAVRS
jgi:hypothetical protein